MAHHQEPVHSDHWMAVGYTLGLCAKYRDQGVSMEQRNLFGLRT